MRRVGWIAALWATIGAAPVSSASGASPRRAAAEAASGCTLAELERLVELAQSARAEAEALGARLRLCPPASGVPSRAVQWLAFSYAYAGHREQARATHAPTPPPGGVGQAAVLARARAGLHGELLQAIDRADPAYASNPEAHLTLARALTRAGRYDRAREAYRVYLRLRPTDEAAETELLYTWLWQGAHAHAEAEMKAALRYGGSAAFRAGIERGIALARRKNQSPAPAARTESRDERPSDARWEAALEAAAIPDVWIRRAARVTYRSPLRVEVASHRLHMEALGGGEGTATEARVGGRYVIAETVGVGGAVGYWSPGTSNALGAAELSLFGPWESTVAVGAAREPLALSRPLLPEAQGLMQDELSLGFTLGEVLAYKGAVRKEGDHAAHERHELVARWTLGAGAREGDFVRLRLPLGLERHPRPSPFYVADPRVDAVGVGIEAGRALARGTALRGQVDHAVVTATARDPAATRRRYGATSLVVELAARLGRGWHAHAALTHHHADDRALLGRRELMSGATLGVSLDD